MITRMISPSAKARFTVLGVILLCLAGIVHASSPGLRYTGRVVYRSNKANAGSLQVELVEAEESGEPTDRVLGSTRADADGHFFVVQTEATDKPVALIAFAVRESADSGGDRRAEGYDIQSHLIRLGFLLNPSPAKPNIVLVEHRSPGRASNE